MAGSSSDFSFTLRLGDRTLDFAGSFPPSGSPSDAMVPTLLGIGEKLLNASHADAPPASCGPRCGACCRQLVPVSLSEAAYLKSAVIPALEPPHRDRVEARISAARNQLEKAGLLEPLRSLPQLTDREQRQSLGIRYFLQQIPCPFLEDESCSIHPSRPFACREYLVTSPPGRCAAPNEGGIQPLPLKIKPSHAMIRADAAATRSAGWTTMITALASDEPVRTRVIADPELELKSFLNGLGAP